MIQEIEKFKLFSKRMLWDNPINIFWILFVTFASYGLKLVTTCYNNDMCQWFYSEPMGLFYQKRWGYAVFAFLGLLDREVPFWSDFFGLLFLIFSAILFAYIVYKMSKQKIQPSSLLIFVLFFISYPLHIEFYVYPVGFLMIAIGHILVFTSLLLIVCGNEEPKKSATKLLFASFLLAIAISMYESQAVVYLTSVLLLNFFLLCKENYPPLSYKLIIKANIPYFFCLLGALFIYILVIKLLSLFFVFPEVTGAANRIIWSHGNLMSQFSEMFFDLGYFYVYNGLFYFAIFVFVSTVFCMFLFVLTRKNDRVKLLVLSLVILLSVFAISFISGQAQAYRYSQGLSLFVCFMWMTFWEFKKSLRTLLLVVIIVIIFLQTKELAIFNNNDYIQSERTIFVLKLISEDLKREIPDIVEKKVVYFSQKRKYTSYNPNIRLTMALPRIRELPRIPSETGISQHVELVTFSPAWLTSYLTGDSPKEVNKYNDMEEYKHWEEMIRSNNQPCWPQKGYARLYGDTVLVNLNGDFSKEIDKESGRNEFIQEWKKILHVK